MIKTLFVQINTPENYLLTQAEINYTWNTIGTIIGRPVNLIYSEHTQKVDIYFGAKFSSKASLSIIATELNKETIKKPTSHQWEQDLLFLNFEPHSPTTSGPLIEQTKEGQIIHNDIIFNCFYMLSGWHEQSLSRNHRGFHQLNESYLHKNHLLHTPIVNIYAHYLKSLFKIQSDSLPLWPEGATQALCLTHDVDYPNMIRSIEAFRYILKHKTHSKLKDLWNIFTGKEHFWKFQEWVQLESKYNIKSAFYFSAIKSNLLRFFLKAPDPFYNIRTRKYKNMIRQLHASGKEIGLHSSYLAYLSEEAFAKEKTTLEQVYGATIAGNRHHFWHLNQAHPEETTLIHEKLGFTYDTSLSFEYHSGFRRGICTPFHLFNRITQKELEILQLPPSIMDDQMFGHSKHNAFDSYQDHIDSIVQAIKHNNGLMMIDAHVRVLNETFFPNWKKACEYLLEKTLEDKCYQVTPETLTQYWIKRESMIKQTQTTCALSY